jgi:hypothetical protein
MKIAGIKTTAKFFPILLIEKDVPVGIFPLYFFNNPVFNSCYSPPQNTETLYLGPLFPDIETMKEEKKQIFLIDVQKAMDQFIKKNLKSRYILINTPPGYTDSRSFKWGGYTVNPRFT